MPKKKKKKLPIQMQGQGAAPEQPFGYPQVYPPETTAIDASLEEELMGVDYDTGLPEDNPGYWYGESNLLNQSNFFEQGNPPLGGIGNPIDYNAPWNVGPYQSFPEYDVNQVPRTPNPNLQIQPLGNPFQGMPNPPPFGTNQGAQDEFDFGNPYPQMDQFYQPQQRVAPPAPMFNPFFPGGMPQMEQLQPMTSAPYGQQFPGVPYGQQLQGLAGYV